MLPEVEKALRLEELSWKTIANLQENGPRMLLLPTGATEQHGPHLPINTDTVIADQVVAYASAQTGIPMLPAMPYTVSAGHTTKWPGTFSLSHQTFIASVRELVSWAVATGWEKLFIINSHFGNDASLRVAVDQLRLEFLGKLQIGVRNSFSLTPDILSYFLCDGDDIHANQAETDLMLYLAPDTVRMDLVEDDPDRTDGTVFSYPVAQTSLNGITGKPSAGTVERGQSLFREMGEALAALCRKALTEMPPLSEEHWNGLSPAPLGKH